MNKKILAAFAATAVLVSGVIGFTACGGGNGVNKGVEVSAEDWSKAFTATLNAKSYTADGEQTSEVKVAGNLEGTDVDVSCKANSKAKFYVDVTNGKSYSESDVTVTFGGLDKLDKEFADMLKEELSDGADSMKGVQTYTVKIGDTTYSATNLSGEWDVEEYGSIGVTDILTSGYATEKGGESKELSALYDAFTYAGGVYTATLWNGSSEVEVSVSIKDGYVIGYSFTGSYEDGDGDSTMTMTMTYIYNFSGFDGTTVTPSTEAEKAITDYTSAN